ncbi:MAG: NADH:flavin oxidoreductase [Streptosporangiales bacterium]|nr:NADH:flavin oxidoreductase [Streptosporangiales bacterium]
MAALWRPFTFGGHGLHSRVVVAPMSRVSTGGDGVPTSAMCDYYRAFARGGFGLVVTEGTYTASRLSQAYTDQPGLLTESQADGWRRVTDAVHEDGALIVAQLMHGGALSQSLTDTLAPSVVQPRGKKMPEYGGSGSYPLPTAMTDADVAEAIAGFATSARLAAAAGFDGVEVHAANGYLLDQFITDYTNLREDRYGGSPGDRARVVAEAVTAIRAATGADLLVGVRLSQAKVNDARHRWQDRAEAAAVLQTVAGARPDYLHLASEGKPWTDSGVLPDHTPLGRLARELTGLPVMVNGGLDDPALAAQVLDDGHADLVSLARGALANPDWPYRVRAGDALRSFHPGMITPVATVANTQHFLANLDRA